MPDSDGLNEWEFLDLDKTSGYRVIRAVRGRAREALLDSYSQPPDESELYGDTFVIDGVRVGEWKWADKTEPDEVPVFASHHAGARPLTDEEREAVIELQRNPPPPKPEPEPLTPSEEERIRAELRAMPVPPELLRRWQRAERFRKGVERERLLQQAAAAKKRVIGSSFVKPEDLSEPPERAVIIDSRGIEHVVSWPLYVRYWREAEHNGSVSPAAWVMFRLGLR